MTHWWAPYAIYAGAYLGTGITIGFAISAWRELRSLLEEADGRYPRDMRRRQAYPKLTLPAVTWDDTAATGVPFQ